MTIKHQIGQKLNLLLFQKGMRVMDLARKIDVPQPTLHRIITGKSKKPHQDTLNKIALFFNIDITELTNDTSDINKKTNSAISFTHAIPLIMIQEDSSFEDMVQASEKTLVVTNDISEEAFGMLLNDESLLPIFNPGSVLIFDPMRKPGIRSYVFVLLGGTNKYLVRQLLTDGEHHFLKPLNPDLAKLGLKVLEDNDKIIGTLIEARQSYL